MRNDRGLRQRFARLEPLEPRILLAAVVATAPSSLSIGVAVDAPISVTFKSAMNRSTITSTTFSLMDSSNNVVAGRISYNAVDFIATFDSSTPLAYGTTYHAVVTGGSGGVKDSSGGALSGNVSWSFTTAPDPRTGPGGPILVVTSTANPFTTYLPEILRAEGLNEFAVADVGALTSALLSSEGVVLLGDMSLTSSQVNLLTGYVTNGGHLIAMHPDKQLAGLLGLTATNATLSNAYIGVNTSVSPGAGITGQTMQFHGTADEYTVNSAQVIATLYSTATTALVNPAVTLRSVGTAGGEAAAFTYDLAKSVIYTRQGNPAWSGQARDGNSVIRSDDLFFGNASFDPEPDWIDLSKVQIPQADEQQRLLANLITDMEVSTMPLPRLWYLPNGDKAVIVMTGDDHDKLEQPRTTADQFNMYLGMGTSDGQPILATSYMFTGSITDTQAAAFAAQGFEMGLHPSINNGNLDTAVNWTSMAQLNSVYQTQLSQFESAYPSLPSPVTSRTHGVVWSDYASQPQVEFANGIRMDLNYYYWPGSWTGNRPGLFTGSGLPMRFATANGAMIDVFQAATQLVDENNAATWPYQVDTLLDNATGPLGYYGAFAVQAHSDGSGGLPATLVPTAVVQSAQAYGVPVITADTLLNFTDGRDNSYFTNLAWNAAALTMTFGLVTAADAAGLVSMLPMVGPNGDQLNSLTYNGNSVSFTTQVIKGVSYAFFNALAGNYVGTYQVDTTPPAVVNQTPATGSTGVSPYVAPAFTFSEDVQPATISLVLKNAAGATVAGAVSYDLPSRTATFTPAAALATNATYTATVSGAKDASGNTMVGSVSTTFTTSSSAAVSIWSPSAVPGEADDSDSGSVELGTKFQVNTAGVVSAIRFYKGPTNIGTHVGHLWTSSGTLLATVTFNNESASGWQQANLSTPVAITPGTTYVVSYYAPLGQYAADVNYFSNNSVTTGPLTALADGVNGGNGVYLYGNGTKFPNQSYDGTNYWVDVVFTPGAGDTTPPAVVSNSPTNGSTGVSPTVTPTFTFSEDVQPATIALVLQDSTGASVAGTVSYDSPSHTATFTPAAALAANTTYTATVSGATDLSGNTMVGSVSTSFTTASNTSVSIWSPSTTPTIVDDGDAGAVELGLKFQSNTAGQITAIRFYKASANTGTHVGHLWTSTGIQLAAVTFTNETASGWQQATLSTPINITPGATYVVSYYAPKGHYSADTSYFAGSGVTSGPLTALSNGAGGGNGVYIYGNGTKFPNQTYSSSNYWVDVVFAPGSGGDTTPPSITARSPASNATNVSRTTTITVTFSEAINPLSLSLGLKAGNTNVSGTLNYNPSTLTATYTPSSRLASQTKYTITLNVADVAGNLLTTSWSFTTGT